METHRSAPTTRSRVIMALDATKARNEREFRVNLKNVQTRGDILRGGDTILIHGVLHKVTHPMGYHVVPYVEGLPSVSKRVMEEEASQKLDSYVNMLLECPESWDSDGVTMEVKIIAGNPLKQVILQEVVIRKASWVILNRHLRKGSKFYIKQIPCKAAMIQDSLSVDVLKPDPSGKPSPIDKKPFYSVSKTAVPLANQVSEVSELPPPNRRCRYAENGTVSIRTDVYVFGIALLQLISGRKIVDSKKDEHPLSLREWAGLLIDGMEPHNLIDPRIGESYDTYLCVKESSTAAVHGRGSADSGGEDRSLPQLLDNANPVEEDI